MNFPIMKKVGDGNWSVTVPMYIGNTGMFTSYQEVYLVDPLSKFFDKQLEAQLLEESQRETGIERYFRESNQ